MKLALLRTVGFLAVAAAGASAAVAEHPRLLKRHGIVYGVRGVGDFANCNGMEISDDCTTYTVSGTIARVDFSTMTHRTEGFMLRMGSGRTKFQNIVTVLPPAAEDLIRRGHHVRVSGIVTGQGRIAVPNEIVAVRPR